MMKKEAKTTEKLIKVHNKQGLNSPKAGWGFYPNKTAAFTLSEIILAIGIIGIIAALTIPQLVQNAQNKELVSAFLKSNNVLANAYKEAKAVDNIQKMGVEDFKETFKKHLKIYDCEEHDVCLSDGMFVDFTCDEEKCTELTVDTNGDKRPNKKGKDWFKFLITEDRIIPQGESEQCSGYDCGMYTLTYHKIFDGLIDNCNTYKAGKCETCDDGYHLSNNKCGAIDFPTCEKFAGETCIECQSGYLLQSSDCISLSDSNCLATDDGKTCKTCNKKYHNEEGVCQEIEDITGCEDYEEDECISCGGMHLQNNQCYAKIGNCYIQDETECTQCNSNYRYNTTPKTCTLVIGNCTSYNTNGTCNTCADRYRNDSTTCTMITIANCKANGYQGVKCINCENTHYVNSSGTCSLLPTNCSTANISGVCTACKSGNVFMYGTTTCVAGTRIYGAYAIDAYDIGNMYIAPVNLGYSPYGTVWVNGAQSPNYYAGALKYCQDRGMTIPDYNTLYYLYQIKGYYPSLIPQSGTYWSSTPSNAQYTNQSGQSVYNNAIRRKDVNFANGAITNYDAKTSNYAERLGENVMSAINVICVKSK